MYRFHSFNLAEHPPDLSTAGISHIGNNSSTTMRRSLASLPTAEGGVCEVYLAGFLIRNLAKRLKLYHRCMTIGLLEVAREHSSVVAGLLEVARKHSSVVAGLLEVARKHNSVVAVVWESTTSSESRNSEVLETTYFEVEQPWDQRRY